MSESKDFFDFSIFQEEVFPDWKAQFKSGEGIGEFSYEKGGPTSLYGTTDMLISQYIIGDLDNLQQPEKNHWAAIINQFQDPKTRKFKKTYTHHYWEHTTAYATCALQLIDKKPKSPMAWADSIIMDKKHMRKWTKGSKRAEWSVIWPGSHVWSGIPAILAMTGEGTDKFFNWYFDWFDKHVDKKTGFWRRGWLHKLGKKPHPHDMFGAFHMYYIYEYFNKKWPYPEKIVDWTLKFQHDNGLWGPGTIYCRDLDGIYCLTRSSRNAEGYRRIEVKEAIISALATAEKQLNDRDWVFARYPNSHKLTGALSAIAECQKFYPDLVKTTKPWNQSIDKACYI